MCNTLKSEYRQGYTELLVSEGNYLQAYQQRTEGQHLCYRDTLKRLNYCPNTAHESRLKIQSKS